MRADWPVQGFHPTRPRIRVDTLYGLVGPRTAAFYAEQGIWAEDQGGPPPYPWEHDLSMGGPETRDHADEPDEYGWRDADSTRRDGAGAP